MKSEETGDPCPPEENRLRKSHHELDAYRKAFDLAMALFEVSKKFPKHERFSLTDQIRRSSRSVCANFAEAWRQRQHSASFKNKLGIAEAETAETQTWLQFAVECGYVERDEGRALFSTSEEATRMLVSIRLNSAKWTF